MSPDRRREVVWFFKRVITRIRRFFRIRPEGFPRTVKKYWYCGEYHLQHKKLGEDDIFLFNPWDMIFRETGLIDGLIPAYRSKGIVGLYKTTSSPYYTMGGSWSDWAYWDDGKNLDLEFVCDVDIRDIAPQLQETCKHKNARGVEGRGYWCDYCYQWLTGD